MTSTLERRLRSFTGGPSRSHGREEYSSFLYCSSLQLSPPVEQGLWKEKIFDDEPMCVFVVVSFVHGVCSVCSFVPLIGNGVSRPLTGQTFYDEDEVEIYSTIVSKIYKNKKTRQILPWSISVRHDCHDYFVRTKAPSVHAEMGSKIVHGSTGSEGEVVVVVEGDEQKKTCCCGWLSVGDSFHRSRPREREREAPLSTLQIRFSITQPSRVL